MPSRRCAQCKTYSKDMWYESPIEAFCSEECAFDKRNKRSSAASQPSRDDIPEEVRQYVLKRDSVCQLCQSTRDLHVHHIFYRSEAAIEWRHDPSNLIVLCAIDHDLVHSDKTTYQRLLVDKMARKGYSVDYVQAKTNGRPTLEAVAEELDPE